MKSLAQQYDMRPVNGCFLTPHLRNSRCTSSPTITKGMGNRMARRIACPAQSPWWSPPGVGGSRSRRSVHSGMRSTTSQVANQCHGLPMPSVKCTTLQRNQRVRHLQMHSTTGAEQSRDSSDCSQGRVRLQCQAAATDDDYWPTPRADILKTG